MKFIHEGTDAAAKAIATQIAGIIQTKKPVIWLVSGGSNIATEVSIMKMLHKSSADNLGSLLILPMDERYGVAGHPDSNYTQLQEAGFDPGDAMWIDILSSNLPLEETVAHFTDLIGAAFPSAQSIIGLFGLGTDGHTAGVLPGSPAVTETVTSVIGYEWPPYTRITLSPTQLITVTTAYLLAYGDTKFKPLTRLQANKESIEKLPAKLLYDIPETFVYNDQLESEA